jgi:hypothetical protein
MSLLLPLGDVAFRINLFSALAGVGCALLLMEIVRLLVQALSDRPTAAAWMGAAAGWFFATTNGAWMQSIRAEVYALNMLLILVAIFFAVRYWDRKSHHAAYALAVTIGLALCNHHYLVFFFLPAPLLMLAATREGRAFLTSGRCLIAGALVLCGLLTYAYLPIRAATDPVINWGDPTTFRRFLDVLTAKTFQGSVSAGVRSVPLGDNLGVAMGITAGQVSIVGFLAALFSFVFLWRRARPVSLFLVAILVGSWFSKAIMLIDPANPDDYGYFLPGVAVLVIGMATFAAFFPYRAAITVCAATLAIGGTSLAIAGYPTLNLSHERSAEIVVEASLERQPPDSVALVNFYSEFFNFWSAQLVYEIRPDITVVHATFDSKRYDGAPYVASLRRRAPHLAGVLDAYSRNHEFPALELLELSRTRPVFLEPMVVNVMGPEPYTNPGLLWQLQLVGNPPELLKQDKRFWNKVLRRIALEGELHPEGIKVLSFSHFLQGILAIRKGDAALTKAIVKRARKFGATSAKFDELLFISSAIEKAGDHRNYRDFDASRLLNVR